MSPAPKTIFWIALFVIIFSLQLSCTRSQDKDTGDHNLTPAETALWEKKDYPAFIRRLEDELKVQPNDPRVLYFLGYSYIYKLQDPKKGTAYLLKSAELGPESRRANYQLCYLACQSSDDEVVSSDFNRFCEQALKITVKTAELLYLHGCVLAKYKKYDLALHELEASLDLNPKYGDALWEVGGVYNRQGKIPKAMEIWDQAAKTCVSPNATCNEPNLRWSRMYQAGCIPGTPKMNEPQCQQSWR